jgi:hypothetical protein
MRGLDELRKSCEASQHQLHEAIQIGVLALTSLEHRISALRVALLSIIRCAAHLTHAPIELHWQVQGSHVLDIHDYSGRDPESLSTASAPSGRALLCVVICLPQDSLY